MTYAITIKRHYYAGQAGVDRRELLLADDWTGSAEYATRDEAAAYIADLDQSPCELLLGEHSRPTLGIVKVGTARYETLRRRTYGR